MKRNKTQLNQNDTGLFEDLDGAKKLDQPPAVPPRTQPAFRPLTQLVAPDQKQLIEIIPAELVTLHALDLPVRSARQRLAALPFALEETVGCPIEQTHFALCGRTPEARHLAATLDADDFARRISATPDRALVAEQMLIAPGQPNEAGRHRWRAFRERDRTLVRVSDGTGFAARSDMLVTLWHRAKMPAVESFGASLPEGMRWLDRSQDGLPPVADLAVFDLRQGVYQPSRGLLRPLKLLAASVAFAAIGPLALAAADVRAQRAIADDLKNQASASLAARLPNASVEADPSLTLRQLTALNQPRRGSAFLPLMDRVSQALLAQEGTVQFRQLAWADDILRLTVEAPGLDALQQAEASLKAVGLRVSSGSATADAGAARAELTVRP